MLSGKYHLIVLLLAVLVATALLIAPFGEQDETPASHRNLAADSSSSQDSPAVPATSSTSSAGASGEWRDKALLKKPPEAMTAGELWRLYKRTQSVSLLEKAVVELTHCKTLRASAMQETTYPDNEVGKERYAAARGKLEKKCLHSELEPNDMELERSIDDGASKGSGYLAALSGIRQAREANQSQALVGPRLCEWMASAQADPEVIRVLTPYITSSERQTTGGKPLDLRERMILLGSLDLLPCDLGADCGADSWRFNRACALDAYCPEMPGSYTEAFLDLAFQREEDRALVRQLRERMKRDITSKTCGDYLH